MSCEWKGNMGANGKRALQTLTGESDDKTSGFPNHQGANYQSVIVLDIAIYKIYKGL